MFKRWLIGILAITMIAGSVWSLNHIASAQEGTNLLTNGSFEGSYFGQGASTRTVPEGWTLLVGSGAPSAFPHNDPVQVLDGEVSWNLNQGYTAFTAVAYQRVGGLKAGDGVKFTAYGWVYTCNDTATSCVIPDPPYRKSDPSAGASLRVGIDPQGGMNPTEGRVKWSTPASPYDRWAEMSVAATAAGDTVTVFMYMTQATGYAINHVYWDKASLVRTEIAPDATATQPFVPFVVPQGVRPDGSIIHTVQANDTLSSIAYAYQEYGVSNESIAALNNIKPNTRFLQIGQELIILPPGSVDPATGQLIPEGQQATATPQTTTAAATLPPAATPIPTEVAALPDATAPDTETSDTGTPATDTEALPMAGEEDTTAPPVTYSTVRAEFIPFENGFMFWLEETNQFYVLTNVDTTLAGTFRIYPDMWSEGMPVNDPALQPPADMFQPERNFGHAWRNFNLKDTLGWALESVQKYTALVVWEGDTMIISSPDGRVYQLVAQDTPTAGSWSAMDFSEEPDSE
jgi:LysM repeat protein